MYMDKYNLLIYCGYMNNELEYTQAIEDAGLSKEQAIVYEVLLRGGEMPASKVTKAIPSSFSLSRPHVYRVLDELVELELVKKAEEKGKIATFLPLHPIAINKVIDSQKEKIERVKKQFLATSGELSSLFNLSVGKPGVQFYEGEDGVWEVLMDSLTASEEILSYADLDAISKYIPALNAEYSALREEKGIKKRGLVVDTPEARKFLSSYDKTISNVRIIKSNSPSSFHTIMQIYDDKISYITLTKDYLIGIIITDPHIAKTHRYLFESMWADSAGEII